jgi:hypothetical protein
MTEIQELQKLIGETNEKSGFNEYASIPDEYKDLYIGNKLMLMVSELAEAQDEIRTGHDSNETYYPKPELPYSLVAEVGNTEEAQKAFDAYLDSKADTTIRKPEGFPSEIADATIRLFSLAYELGIDLEEIMREKIAYNGTRAYKHGKKF